MLLMQCRMIHILGKSWLCEISFLYVGLLVILPHLELHWEGAISILHVFGVLKCWLRVSVYLYSQIYTESDMEFVIEEQS